jgi:hypothetical protein
MTQKLQRDRYQSHYFSMKCLIQAVSLWMSLPLMADPQLPAKPLSPPPVAASSSAATGAPLATDSSVSGKISFVGGTSILTKEGRNQLPILSLEIKSGRPT